jgi:hypothetical protein
MLCPTFNSRFAPEAEIVLLQTDHVAVTENSLV